MITGHLDGGLKCDRYRISRDLYSKKLKICFEYDGIFHFKNIFGQLENKQKKDIALEKWCIKNNWRLIRVSDSWFNKHKLNLDIIEKLLYKTKKQIIKIGLEYYI